MRTGFSTAILLRIAILAGSLCGVAVFAAGGATPITASERALIAFVNMYTGDRGFIKDKIYFAETLTATRAVQTFASHYGYIRYLTAREAKLGSFYVEIAKLEADPTVRAIDVVIYVHGKPRFLNVVNEGLGLLQAQTRDVPVDSIVDRVRALRPKKLRALYSDACYGSKHLEDWKRAGFRVAAGSRGVDTNHECDLILFLRAWTQGADFARAIDAANGCWMNRATDFLIDGDSFKERSGQVALTISSAP